MKSEHIKNPFRGKKKKINRKDKKVGMVDFLDIPNKRVYFTDKNPEEWKPKDFVHWFKDCLEKEIPGMPSYRIVYIKDCGIISSIIKHFEENDLSKEDIKEFIGYIIKTEAKNVIREKIEKGKHKFASFTTNDLMDFVNPYMQQLSFGKSKEKTVVYCQDVVIVENIATIDELKDCYKNDKLFGLLRNYGIPITATFLFNEFEFKGKEKEKNIASSIHKILKNLDLNRLERVLKHSILRAPYNDNFKLLNWREIFEDIWINTNFSRYEWWTDKDEIDNYRGIFS